MWRYSCTAVPARSTVGCEWDLCVRAVWRAGRGYIGHAQPHVMLGVMMGMHQWGLRRLLCTSDTPTANKANELPMTLPSECEPFLLRSGGSSNLTEHGGTKGAAAHGGHWSACTHLKSYGLNVDFGVLNMLLALQPRSSLELGSGMGL